LKYASPAGTAKYSAGHPEITYNALGNTGLEISSAGFGGYRVDAAVAAHRAALAKALEAGINLIDTSANYADGGSERLVGEVVSDLCAQGKIQRDCVVVVSKGGYLQGENYRMGQMRQQAGTPFPELVQYDVGLDHCIHPVFLEDQLSRSLNRLRMETLDCYLLHNPEYYLSWAKTANLPQTQAKGEYLRRIREAFLHLEREVGKGRIRGYGISSNTSPRQQDDYEFSPLSEIWEIAQKISAKHHFRVIQFPLNLFETGAMTEANQPGGQSVIEFAADKGLGVITNRTLNAIQDGKLIRLSEQAYQGKAARQASDFHKRIVSLETSWASATNLSQLALRAIRATKGVSAALVGMRQEKYVQDVLEELYRPSSFAAQKDLWQKIKEEQNT